MHTLFYKRFIINNPKNPTMTVKVYIETYGCAVNQADSEIMAGIIKKRGYELVNNPDDAYVIIINTCTVKTPTENNLFKRQENHHNRLHSTNRPRNIKRIFNLRHISNRQNNRCY